MRWSIASVWHVLAVFCALISGRAVLLAQETKAPYFPEDSTVVVYGDVSAIRKHQDLALIPWELAAVSGKENFGVDPFVITQFWGAMNLKDPSQPPGIGFRMTLSEAVAIEDLNPQIFDEVRTSEKVPGTKVRTIFGSDTSVVQTKDQYMLGTEETLRKMMAAKEVPNPLVSLIAKDQGMVQVVVAVSALRPMLLQAIDGNGGQLTEEMMKDLQEIVETAEYVHFRIEEKNLARVYMHVGAKDEAGLNKLSGLIQGLQERGLEAMEKTIVKEGIEGSMSENLREGWSMYLKRMRKLIQSSSKPEKEGERLTVVFDLSNTSTTAGVAIAVLLPAVQAAREAARRTQSMNNLKQLALAFHNHESAYKRMPNRFIEDGAGEPLLSWRVHLLPFLEQQELYSKFHLDEPWNSEHNAKLLQEMPALFRDARSKAPPGHTTYLVPHGGGEDTPTIWDLEDRRFAEVTDGLSNTLLFINAPDSVAVPWTKPEDLDLSQIDLQELLQEYENTIDIGIADGSVRTLSKFIDIETLKAILSCNGGEVVELP